MRVDIPGGPANNKKRLADESRFHKNNPSRHKSALMPVKSLRLSVKINQ